MNVLIRQVILIAPTHEMHLQKVDIHVLDGIIQAIDSSLSKPKDATIIEADHLHLSIGWLDIGTQVGEPGLEHREDFRSVSSAAAKGGYTALACAPNTMPAVDSKATVQYTINNTIHSSVDFHPIGAISQATQGKDLAELYDMAQAGAVAFSDGKKPIQNAALMLRALDYVKAFDGVLINRSEDATLAHSGQMNEGYHSTMMGTVGIPHVAEELMLQRDIDLVKYTQSKLHISAVSTARSVDLIRAAKKEGLNITASVAIMNLIFEDEVLTSFDPNFKVLPPLRTKNDRLALIKGVKDGTIDTIISNHVPLDVEANELEFAYAKFGAIGLETVFPLWSKYLKKKIDLSILVEKLAYNSRKCLNLPLPKIEEGAKCNFTLFQTQQNWTFEKSASKSKNTPFLGEQFDAKIYGIINGTKMVLCD